MFHYVYPKYFCRVDDYSIKNKLSFEFAYAAYQNQQKAIVQLPEPQQQQRQIVKIKQEQINNDDEKIEIVEEKTTSASVKPEKKDMIMINFF